VISFYSAVDRFFRPVPLWFLTVSGLLTGVPLVLTAVVAHTAQECTFEQSAAAYVSARAEVVH